MCERGLRLLSRDSSKLLRLVWRWHSRLCRACAEVRSNEQWLDRYTAKAGQWETPASMAPVLPDAAHTAAAVRKEAGNMRRLAYAVAAMVVIAAAAAVLVPGRGRKQDARGLLLSAVHAMELADSIHVSGFGNAPDETSPAGIRMQPDRFDIWLSRRALAVRQTDPTGKILAASGLSLDTGEHWAYGSDSGVCHVADIRPVADKVAEMIDRGTQALLTDNLRAVIETGLTDVTESVATETRNGRQVRVVTYRGTFATSPRHITHRYVFDLEPDTDHMIAMHQYAQAEGSPEELVAKLDQIEYGVPVPANLAPADAKTVRAEAIVEDTDRAISLIMQVDGKEVGRTEAPRPKRNQQ